MSYHNGTRIVNTGLIAYVDAANFKSYSGSGSIWRDVSGNGYNASLLNVPIFTSSFRGEFIFDGSSSYAAFTSMYDFSISNQFTALLWAKSNKTTWNDNGFLLSKRNQLIIHPSSGSTGVTYYAHTTSGWQSFTVTPSNITVYNQYCITFNSGSCVGYLNGVRANSGNFSPSLSSDTGELLLGRDDGNNRYLSGSIALASVYNRALTDDEVKQNYDAVKGRFGL